MSEANVSDALNVQHVNQFFAEIFVLYIPICISSKLICVLFEVDCVGVSFCCIQGYDDEGILSRLVVK